MRNIIAKAENSKVGYKWKWTGKEKPPKSRLLEGFA
jgi:hypothetical protein